jgi:hypothetical protein
MPNSTTTTPTDEAQEREALLRKLDATPLLYTDTISGEQTLRDDLWVIDTATVQRLRAALAAGEWDESLLKDAVAGGRIATMCEQCLLIAHGEADAPVGLTWCADRNAVLRAVKAAVWFQPEDADEEEAQGITETLFEHGWMRFEGDPPLQLLKIATARRA